ncbi:cold shock domain-containing protein [Pseudomonas sp. TNT11]|jgi:CspA family cold shock protein|uniref:Cold shock domain-containing protein n=1 Tax=Pseudomonas emilianonis TaxID=2915812 RepID=A0ABT0EJE9_9PSED|nr:cold shock domain-containing protein [Pseudomonas emilianonis]MCK1785855.1 cold shock domain-containing protein [Pseudomonas emilianonis]
MPSKTPQTAIFISSETVVHDTQDVFFRSSTAQGGRVLREGQTVTYEVERGPGGEWQAVNIEIVEEPTLN